MQKERKEIYIKFAIKIEGDYATFLPTH